jgi:hypothetical protein
MTLAPPVSDHPLRCASPARMLTYIKYAPLRPARAPCGWPNAGRIRTCLCDQQPHRPPPPSAPVVGAACRVSPHHTCLREVRATPLPRAETAMRRPRRECADHHPLALVRDASAGGWLCHPDDPGVAGAQRGEHHHDLYSCPEPWRQRCSQPGRPTLTAAADPAVRLCGSPSAAYAAGPVAPGTLENEGADAVSHALTDGNGRQTRQHRVCLSSVYAASLFER